MTAFTATQAGAISDGGTFGLTSPGVKGTDWPNETDDLIFGGFNLTQGSATAVGSMVGGNNTFTLTGSFTCTDVREVRTIVPNLITTTLDFGTSGTDPGCTYSGTGRAIDCQIGGIVTTVTGDVVNSGSGYGFYNSGTCTDFAGTLKNRGSGVAAHNAGTWTAFTGTLRVESPAASAISGTAIPFSGTITGGILLSQVDA